jgi:hypothetical protein
MGIALIFILFVLLGTLFHIFFKNMFNSNQLIINDETDAELKHLEGAAKLKVIILV